MCLVLTVTTVYIIEEYCLFDYFVILSIQKKGNKSFDFFLFITREFSASHLKIQVGDQRVAARACLIVHDSGTLSTVSLH